MTSRPLKVCFVVGARPNFMKAAPVLRALEQLAPSAESFLVHTGQHYDREMSDVFLEELGLPRPDHFLAVGAGTHAEQTARALVGIERVLVASGPSLVVVPGDVNSTLAGALAAVKLGYPVAHIESGLRSFDETMPEEHNRRLTDHLSRLLFAHSSSAEENLRAEGIRPERVHLVGNTMVDTLLAHVDRGRSLAPWESVGLEPGEYGLVTLHRPGLVDDPEKLSATVEGLRLLAGWRPLVFPVHPRTRARLRELALEQPLAASRVVLAEPLSYHAFLGLEVEAAFVLTDSGGVQEETSALGIPCFTLRDSTERPVTVDLGTNTLLGERPDRIPEVAKLVGATGATGPPPRIPLWDGRAGARAAEVVARFVCDSG